MKRDRTFDLAGTAVGAVNCGTAAARQHERRLQHGRLRGAPGKGPPPRPVVAVNRLSQGMGAIDYREVCDYLLPRGMGIFK